MRLVAAALLLALAGKWQGMRCKPELRRCGTAGAGCRRPREAAGACAADACAAPTLPFMPAGAQLVHCAGAGSAAYDEAELVREVEAAAAVAGAAAEPAIPIAPAAPTFTPLVPTKAEVICMDGAAPAIKLNTANCVARYTPVYKAMR